MWERKQKGKWGQTTSISRSDPDKHKPYDAIPGVKYTVEYLRTENVEAAEKANLRGSEIAPWEVRDSYTTDQLGLFIREILRQMFEPETAEYWAFHETETAEVCAEIPGDTRNMVRRLVCDELKQRTESQTRQIEVLERELNLYKKFIKKANAERMFREFKREEENGK